MACSPAIGLLAAALTIGLTGSVAPAAPEPAMPAVECSAAPDGPRTLVVSLDGVAFDVVEAARAEGAFADWPETRAMVSTFPSMTNIAFSAIFSPLQHERMAGYEMRHYDRAANRIVSGSADYAERSGGWRNHYDIMHNSVGSKAKAYMRPRSDARGTLKEIETLVLESPQEVMLAHIKGTDILAHFRGNDEVTELLTDLAAGLEALALEHEERHGRPLRVLLFSDHGNSEQKIRFKKGIRDRLREAGLEPNDKLVEPRDVVTPTYGVVGFGVVFTDPSNAETTANALIGHEAVDVAAWIAGPERLGVLSDEGRGTIRWSERPDGRHFAYDGGDGDPLHLARALETLRERGALDADGFAHEDVWFRHTALGDYPDAPRRLLESLDGTWVENAATVILSFAPGYAWGQAKVRFGAYVGGGHQEGTHGGLDRDSTLGFYLTNDPTRVPEVAVRADRVLAHWKDVLACD